MEMKITFPGGVAVAAHFEGHVVATDQPERAGGADTAPAPFDLFLASIGTCAGLYALRFCQQRGIDTAALRVSLATVRDEAARRIARIEIAIDVPPGFPEKYHEPLRRAVDQCAVKRHILEPPEFVIDVR